MDAPSRQPVPVFPLPDLVLFPRTTAALHIFELRYRTMVRDALSRDRVIALALLAPGHEWDYLGSPAFHDLGCLARIQEVEWLPNDCYDLRVEGTGRIRFGRIVTEFPYRSARVEPLPEHPLAEDDPLVQIERRALTDLCARVGGVGQTAGGIAAARVPLNLGRDDPYERVVNTACLLCQASPEERLSLLGEDSLIERGRRARALMEQWLTPRPPTEGEDPAGERN